MIVVAIIAILAAIALPAYHNYILRTKIRLAQSDLLTLATNVESFRQRTLAYPADQEQAERGWNPASDAADFSFSFESEDGGYLLSATASDQLGKAAKCVLSVDDGHARNVGSECSRVGVTDW